MEGSVRCSANYVPLSPISFLERAANVYGDQVSIVYGDQVKFTWKETFERCVKLASTLVTHLGVSRGDIVAALAPNVPELYELQFGVPMAGGVLSNINPQYDSKTVSRLLEHSNAKVVFVDHESLDAVEEAIEILARKTSDLPKIILISDADKSLSIAPTCNHVIFEYKDLLYSGSLEFDIKRPIDECDAIAVTFTSGTTGNSKGVVYSHRGAYLNSLAAALTMEMHSMPVFLWSMPMFHCNGWCFPWAMAAQGGKNVCMRVASEKNIFESIARHHVTHMGGAPTVLNMITNASPVDIIPISGTSVKVMTGGSPPPPQVILKMEELGFKVYSCFGCTECYGPATVCTWKPEWASLPPETQASLKARHGLNHVGMQEIDVKDPITMKSVPKDAKTLGEVMLRGNTIMCGYFKNAKATENVFKGGWYRSGDLGVIHPDGYIQVKDRCIDGIVSSGQYISSISIEVVLFGHPKVFEAAVVGAPDDHFGEVPCAFVKLKDGHNADADEIIEYCRTRLPENMTLKMVVFEDLPKTATGKTQKVILREKAKMLYAQK
ncbi:probable acyl-activating enzyme 1, peroxisomal [Cynara cardunculus var. scolymus]|nr:probable acyl-activating enzyme 1, peroxisomal [Cynara cardunculus var. scolymus]